jgi:hypothetical protein
LWYTSAQPIEPEPRLAVKALLTFAHSGERPVSSAVPIGAADFELSG